MSPIEQLGRLVTIQQSHETGAAATRTFHAQGLGSGGRRVDEVAVHEMSNPLSVTFIITRGVDCAEFRKNHTEYRLGGLLIPYLAGL